MNDTIYREVPDYLAHDVEVLRAAYPNGVSTDEYPLLVYRLCESMSMRGASMVLDMCGFRNYYSAYNDTQAYAYRHDEYAEASKPVLAKLIAHGYEPDAD